jgi:uncharacterized protein
MGKRWTRALVTGASSGIGNAIARLLASEGTELVVVARDRTRLEALANQVKVPCQVLVADLNDRWELANVEDRLSAQTDPIDLLVNNAGFGFVGRYDELDLDKEVSVVNVNVVALMRLSHVAAAAMATRTGRRDILNVSSVAGFIPSPTSATYAATKAFVTSLSQAMHEELLGTGIGVTALCPGFTRTEFQDRANAGDSTNKIPKMLWQTAEAVALAGLDGMAANKAIVIPGQHNKALAGLISALPKGAVRRIVGASAKQGL